MAKSSSKSKVKKVAPGKTEDTTSSPFVKLTRSLYLSLSPCAANFPVQGLCAEHISPLILTYYPPFGGVVLSFSNARISETPQGAPADASDAVLSRSIDEYGVTYVWLTADFLIFRPRRGVRLEGHITLQNESILGLICYNYFNAGIQSDRLPADWTWGGECYLDGNGNKVDGKIEFTVHDFEASGTENIQIAGTLR